MIFISVICAVELYFLDPKALDQVEIDKTGEL